MSYVDRMLRTPDPYAKPKPPTPQVSLSTFIPNYSQVPKTNTPLSIPNYSQVKKVDTPGFTSTPAWTQQASATAKELASIANTFGQEQQQQYVGAPSYDYSQRHIVSNAPNYININMPPIQPFESMANKLVGGGASSVKFDRWERPEWISEDPFTPTPGPPAPTGFVRDDTRYLKLMGRKNVDTGGEQYAEPA